MKKIFLFVLVVLSLWTVIVVGETSFCHRLYCDGGAEAVKKSKKCPQWSLGSSSLIDPNPPLNCSQSLFDQLKRSYGDQAHIFCDAKIPISINEVKEVGLLTVLFGVIGKESRERVRKNVEDFFFFHLYFLLEGNCSSRPHRFHQTPNNFGAQILKESLLKTIHDVDVQLSKEAFTKNVNFECVGEILLTIDGQVFVTSFGCSHGFRCSNSQENAKFRLLGPKQSLYADDEESNKDSAFQRPLGLADEEAGLHQISLNDSYLDSMSNGISRNLMIKDVCNVLMEAHWYSSEKLLFSSCGCLSEDSMAENAFDKDGEKNGAAIPISFYPTMLTKEHEVGGDGGLTDYSNLEADVIKSPVIQVEELRAFVSLMKKVDPVDKVDDGHLSHKRSKTLVIYDNGHMCFHFEMHGKDGGKCMILHAVDMLLYPSATLSIADTDSKGLEFPSYISPLSRYILEKRVGKGGFGEAWLSFHLNCTQEKYPLDNERESLQRRFCLDPHSIPSQSTIFNHDCHPSSEIGDYFIIKRVMVEKGYSFYLSGLREKHFGEILFNTSAHCKECNQYVARYIESLDCGDEGIWVVFRHEGIPFSKLLYATEDPSTGDVNSAMLLQRSSYWNWLRKTAEGQEEMKQIILQLLMALKFCHDLDITHRDIKPDNMVLCFEYDANHRCLKQRTGDNQQLNMRIIDFGSALDEFTIKHLYGSRGPSSYEQSYDYTPPEALLNPLWFQGPKSSRVKYDMWSVGVVMLEMIIGSPQVFQLTQRAQSVLASKLKGLNKDEMGLYFRMAVFVDMCILRPQDLDLVPDPEADNLSISSSSRKCSDKSFSDEIKKRDPLSIGFTNVWALQLVRQLLRWDPDERLSAEGALQHRYFQPH